MTLVEEGVEVPANCQKLTEDDAARAIARGCHKPLKPLGEVRYFEPFSLVLGKLRRNCRYTISDANSKQFAEKKT